MFPNPVDTIIQGEGYHQILKSKDVGILTNGSFNETLNLI